jgi:hypothetical protein
MRAAQNARTFLIDPFKLRRRAALVVAPAANYVLLREDSREFTYMILPPNMETLIHR